MHQPDDGSGRFNGVRVATIILPVFERLAPDCPELIPATLRLLPSTVGLRDRKVLIESIGKYGPTAKAIVPDLLKLLDDGRGLPSYDRMDGEIAGTLGAIGPDAKAGLPALRKLLDHPELKVALAAQTPSPK